VAKPHDYGHFTMKQCMFVYKHDETGSRGVVLEKPSAFTLKELAPAMFESTVFADHAVHLGGRVRRTFGMWASRREGYLFWGGWQAWLSGAKVTWLLVLVGG